MQQFAFLSAENETISPEFIISYFINFCLSSWGKIKSQSCFNLNCVSPIAKDGEILWVIFFDILNCFSENSLFRYLTHFFIKKNWFFFSGPVFVCYLCILENNPIFYVRYIAVLLFCGLLLHLIDCFLGCVEAFILWDPTCQLFYSWTITGLFRKIQNVLSYTCVLYSTDCFILVGFIIPGFKWRALIHLKLIFVGVINVVYFNSFAYEHSFF